ncbi:MAG TPA: glucose-6-phosphate dehydrogenase [Gemmatimonadales bacterium]|nr:glucose-6-phosphate dehydrogenase [Gemmatimonadales bacterium]
MIERLVLFGATGDLAGRFLLPALAALRAAGRLPEQMEVRGIAREALDDEAFRRVVAQRLERYAGDTPSEARAALMRSLSYRPVDLDDPRSVAQAVYGTATDDGQMRADVAPATVVDGGPSSRPLVAYLALPPSLFAAAIAALGAVGLPAGSRIAVEKPFGEDLDSAVALNRLLAQVAGAGGERAVFRVDHVLGLATVQNLLGLRVANDVLEPAWNSAHVDQVELLWEETIALEGRAEYYDRTGALRDAVQNHLLQLLCLIAMEPPGTLGEGPLHDRKLEVLRAVRPLRAGEIPSRTRRARYTAGRLPGRIERRVPAYAEEPGVDPERKTETFAELVLELDSRRWAGTRFRLRAGKALSRRRKEIVVRFRPPSSSPFGPDVGNVTGNALLIGVDGPEDLALRLTGAAAGPPFHPVPLSLTAPPPASALPAYGRVLLDILEGGSTLSVRADEAEAAWRVVTPVLQAWAAGLVPLEEYPAGSAGPPPLRIPAHPAAGPP